MSIIFSSSKDAIIAANEASMSKRFARIVCKNGIQSVVANGSVAGFDAGDMLDPATYNKFKTNQSQGTQVTIIMDLNTSFYDSLCINNPDSGFLYSVTVEFKNNGAVVESISGAVILPITSTLFSFESVACDEVVITGISGSSTAFSISNAVVGKELIMPHAIYGGHSPLDLSRQTAIRPVVSEGGQLLGRSVIKKGVATSYEWKNLNPTWYRNNFDLFAKDARTTPFFIAWRPEGYPFDVNYVWTNNDIKPQNMGISDFMSVSMSVVGVDNAS